MEKIPSFTIDHIRLLRGIYVSRQDKVGTETVTTFDVRMKEPNREPALSPSAILKGDLKSADILPLMIETFRFIADYEGEVPGATAKDCGNYLMMNLPMAKWEARKYLEEVLEKATEENLNYPG